MGTEPIVPPTDTPLGLTDTGERAPLLLVHAWPLDRAMWAPQVSAFAGERRVLAPDLAGFGDAPGPGHATLDAHADDLAGLLDALGIARAVVVGLSMGGYIALALARRHPARLAALVLADTRAGADDAAARANRDDLAAVVATAGLGALSERLLPRLLAPGARPAVAAEVGAIIARQRPEGVVAALRAMAARPDAGPGLAEVRVPTLVLAGAEDALTPPSEARGLAAAIAGAGLVVIPGAGHLASLEEPGAFNAALRAFLADLAGPAWP